MSTASMAVAINNTTNKNNSTNKKVISCFSWLFTFFLVTVTALVSSMLLERLRGGYYLVRLNLRLFTCT